MSSVGSTPLHSRHYFAYDCLPSHLGLDKSYQCVIIHRTTDKGNHMSAKYEIGQKVVIKPVNEQSLSTRDSELCQYASLTGEITNYHWIRPPTSEVFYLYTVQIGTSNREIVLYEDEIEHAQDTKPSRRKLKG